MAVATISLFLDWVKQSIVKHESAKLNVAVVCILFVGAIQFWNAFTWGMS